MEETESVGEMDVGVDGMVIEVVIAETGNVVSNM